MSCFVESWLGMANSTTARVENRALPTPNLQPLQDFQAALDFQVIAPNFTANHLIRTKMGR